MGFQLYPNTHFQFLKTLQLQYTQTVKVSQIFHLLTYQKASSKPPIHPKRREGPLKLHDLCPTSCESLRMLPSNVEMKSRLLQEGHNQLQTSGSEALPLPWSASVPDSYNTWGW
jgi:hypothetical protein